MKRLAPIEIHDKKVEAWLEKRTSQPLVTYASTVRDALAALMRQEKESKNVK